jgi:hypothetical protein
MLSESQSTYWFPGKRYGWGWGTPLTWQGWAVLPLWLAIVITGVRHFAYRHGLLQQRAFTGAMVSALLLIGYLKGEPPRWRWGK